MLAYSLRSHIGKVRSTNQDYCVTVPELGIFLLADGMGGARGGERASQLAVQTAAEILRSSPERDFPLLLTAFREANLRILEEAYRNPSLQGMGTTLIAALIAGEQVWIASVGDSRAYRFTSHALLPLTKDQSWVAEVGIPLGLSKETLKQHPMRHVITMAVGIDREITIGTYNTTLSERDILLLSSDGLHGVVSHAKMEEILAGPGNLDTKADLLIAAACDAGAPDNISLILLQNAI